MNSDLARERARSHINVQALTHLLDGGPDITLRRKELEAIIENDHVFTNKDNLFMSRPERYRHGLRKARRYEDLKKELNLRQEDDLVVKEALNDTLPTGIHPLMFVPNVEALCTDEQRNFWLPRCESMEVIGCYAQTELGHGSNIRALETTATFLPETDEFEIHTPTTSAAKWWPGTMGRTANHAMVIAQLVIGGKQYGIHNFIVPIRGTDDHLPLQGVRIGDIGPKIGFNTMDNGFCIFNHVRIPRLNMAMRYAKVDRQGNYITTGDSGSKIAYITVMQVVRAYLVGQAGRALAKAVVIATRYSVVRRQGFKKGGEKTTLQHQREHQVLDYTIQMHRLLPLLVTAYAFHFTGRVLAARLQALEREHIHGESDKTQPGGGSGDTLKQFHAASSGLKSLCTTVAAAGIEDCRKACGGHGFLEASGLPEHLGTYLQACTVEGENHMLTQQVTRILLQELSSAAGGKVMWGDCVYMSKLTGGKGATAGPTRRCVATSPSSMRDVEVIEAALEHRALRLLLRVRRRLDRESREGGRTAEDAWNRALVEVVRASHAHCYLIVFQSFRERVHRQTSHAVGDRSAGDEGITGPTLDALHNMLSLFGLYWIERDMGDFAEDGFLSPAQAGWVRDEVVELLHILRPMAIPLVDAWDMSDFQLNSALGRYDGNVYEALMETTERNPMNHSDPVEGYEDYLRPVIKGARDRRLSVVAQPGNIASPAETEQATARAGVAQGEMRRSVPLSKL
ncbi:unnamed protein product [Discosporangium mesarthrocarpum]